MAETNVNARLEAFCDGVFAIALTLLIIDVKLPPAESLAGVDAVWRALQHLTPRVFAFLLSFCIILITWVAHHATLKLVSRSSAAFIYANGFLLLTVVFVPFPTGLLGDFILTGHAAPRDGLVCDATSAVTIRENNRNGYFAFALYSLLSVTALWFPVAVAVVTTVSWIFWLALGLRMKHDRPIAEVPVVA